MHSHHVRHQPISTCSNKVYISPVTNRLILVIFSFSLAGQQQINPALAANANIPPNMNPANIPGAAAAAAAQMQAANQMNPMNQMANKQQMVRNQPPPNAMYQGNVSQ